MRLVKDDEGRVHEVVKRILLCANDDPSVKTIYHLDHDSNEALVRVLFDAGMTSNNVYECLEWLEDAVTGWLYAMDNGAFVVTVKVIDDSYKNELPPFLWPGAEWEVDEDAR